MIISIHLSLKEVLPVFFFMVCLNNLHIIIYNVMSSRGPNNPVIYDMNSEDTVSDRIRDLKTLEPNQEHGEC